MTDKPLALRLAEELPWVKHTADWESCNQSADELRQLYAANEKFRKHIESQNDELDQLIAMAERLETQRDELLAALNAMLTHMGMDEDKWNKPTFDQARSAIAKVKGEKQ